ncbi:MAG: hypothetical protein OQK75_08755 [Gammaproteobacteria bacterium]|nr:hypothetical protein [Gammaproteobacteria bacterium]MCW8987740.1 hypothetical protein [Gammaproteobacteria bacterium]MCW9029965.1 hypothetical protein [Gammaproteobacteria bacterium]
MKIRVINIITGVLVLFSPLSYAEIDISGYASFKAIANSNDQKVSYYNGLAPEGEINTDSRESNLGIQFSTDISPKMDMTVVMSARGGPSQKYNFETEWAYANYKFNDDLSLRIGKVKGPFYMVSDYKDVGYAYPWASVPDEVYSTNPIRSVNGLDLVYQKTINNVTYLGELYYGSGNNTSFILPTSLTDLNAAFSSSYTTTSQVSFKTHDMLGFNASVSFDGMSFRLGYFDTKVDAFGQTDLEGSFGGIGMTIDKNNFVVYAEYIARDTGPGLEMAFPDANAGYLTLGYRMGDFLPYVTAASIGEGADKSIYTPKQTSTTLGLRYELDDAAALKIEAKNIKPDTYNPTPDAGGLFDGNITENVTIVTVAIDVLF